MTTLHRTFRDEELAHINNQAMIYMCACPAQVSAEIRSLRELIQYQRQCISNNDSNSAVHKLIAQACEEAHATLERCLAEVLELEGWDRETLEMPSGLRQLRDQFLDNTPPTTST